VNTFLKKCVDTEKKKAMTLSYFRFTVYCVIKAIRHPMTEITYHYCPSCRVRFHASSKECPKCGDEVGHSPDSKQESPTPWWGSILCIVIGITCWILGASIPVTGLDEAGRALVYIPLGSLFGLSVQK